MEGRQEFWETLKQKYEQKNRTLQEKEQGLRHRLEAMDAVIGECSRRTKEGMRSKPSLSSPPCTSSPNKPQPSVLSHTENENIIISQHLTANVMPEHFDYRSCQCPPPQEKPGLFKCFWGLFGSSKPKDPSSPGPINAVETPGPTATGETSGFVPSPPAPQDVPTRDDRQCEGDNLDKFGYPPYKNENCMCNPCIVDVPLEQEPTSVAYNTPQKKDNDAQSTGSCNCSTCASPTGGTYNMPQQISNNNDIDCPCNYDVVLPDPKSTPGTYNVPKKNSNVSKNNETGGTCNCNVCTRSFSSVIPGDQKFGKAECPCNIFDVDDECICAPTPKEFLKNMTQGNGNKTSNIYTNATNNQQARNASSCLPSSLSLKSADLLYMQNIHDLATQQKNFVRQITDLEKKAKIYDEVFNEYKNVDFSSKGREDRCRPCPGTTPASDSDQKSNAELKLENFLLKNELKDMRLEVRQYLERMEGPMQFKIESERYKCLQLEQKLEEAARELANLQDFYQKEINGLKLQLCTANTNIYNLATLNAQLNEDLEKLGNRCAKLEEDLIRQKISEAETIKSLQAALNAQNNVPVVKDECDLHQIARELSKILKECEPCGDCMNLPEDLTAAARLLKSLTDMVDNKLGGSDEGQPLTGGRGGGGGGGLGAGAGGTADTTIRDVVSKETAQITDTLDIVVVQELINVGAPPIEERTSSIKEASQSTNPEPIENRQSQQDRVSFHPETQSVESGPKSVQSNPVSKVDEPDAAPQVEEKNPSVVSEQLMNKQPSVKSEPFEGATQSVKSGDPGAGDQKSERSAKEPSVVERTSIQPDLSTARPKISCSCVKARKSAQVDQLWPKSNEPPVMKNSSLLETTAVSSKKKCNCSISRKLREQAQAKIDREAAAATSSRTLCKCDKRSSEQIEEVIEKPVEVTESESKPDAGNVVDQVRPTTSERFKLTHQITASKSKDLLKSETSIKCLKVKENFPFDIDTTVDVINKPPDGVHVTTTITNSGTLEVVTEGPEGVIETTLIYTNSGNVEVVTEIFQYQGKEIKGGTRVGTSGPAIEGPDAKAIEGPEETTTPADELAQAAETGGEDSKAEVPESAEAAETAGGDSNAAAAESAETPEPIADESKSTPEIAQIPEVAAEAGGEDSKAEVPESAETSEPIADESKSTPETAQIPEVAAEAGGEDSKAEVPESGEAAKTTGATAPESVGTPDRVAEVSKVTSKTVHIASDAQTAPEVVEPPRRKLGTCPCRDCFVMPGEVREQEKTVAPPTEQISESGPQEEQTHEVQVEPDQTTPSQAGETPKEKVDQPPEVLSIHSAGVVQDANKSPNAAPDTSGASPEDTGNVNVEISDHVESMNTQEVALDTSGASPEDTGNANVEITDHVESMNTPEVALDTSGASPEDTGNVNVEISDNVENVDTPEVAENVENMDPSEAANKATEGNVPVAKSLSLSLHVDNAESLGKMAEPSDEEKAP